MQFTCWPLGAAVLWHPRSTRKGNPVQRVAVVGSGIAGLTAARALSRVLSGHGVAPAVTLFEAGAHFGGHANTVDMSLGGVRHGVDTGFLVYNQRTYPGLTRLFDELGVESAAAEMSFSVQVRSRSLEWSGTNLAGVFAQRSNLARPAFWRMLADIVRFNRVCTALSASAADTALAQSVADFLAEHRFSPAFRQWYLLPMIACIWSCPSAQMMSFPIGTLIRFCHNHGLLQLSNRPQWLSVKGGSRNYVRRIVDGLRDARLNTRVLGVQRLPTGVLVRTASGTEHFEQLVLACHSDQALRLLGDDATAAERRVLGAIRYQRNRALLHTDASLLPQRRSAWAAWNYETAANGAEAGVCLHYLINRLQALPWQQPVIVSLNPVREPQAERVVQEFSYEHPVFDLAATAAQRQLADIQGQRQTWFCGAWAGYGFHEDGLQAGQSAAAALLGATPGQQAWAA